MHKSGKHAVLTWEEEQRSKVQKNAQFRSHFA